MKNITDEIPATVHGKGKEPRIEPFSTVADLASDFGKLDLLQCLQLLSELYAEDGEYCHEYREEQAWLSLEIAQLILKWQRRSQPPLPMVNSPGIGAGCSRGRTR
jgi:hypothetical protein